MTKKERKEIEEYAAGLSDEQLESKYYDALYDCLGSQTEDMYELGYDISDIVEREKYERFLSEKADVLEYLCTQRGIELFRG